MLAIDRAILSNPKLLLLDQRRRLAEAADRPRDRQGESQNWPARPPDAEVRPVTQSYRPSPPSTTTSPGFPAIYPMSLWCGALGSNHSPSPQQPGRARIRPRLRGKSDWRSRQTRAEGSNANSDPRTFERSAAGPVRSDGNSPGGRANVPPFQALRGAGDRHRTWSDLRFPRPHIVSSRTIADPVDRIDTLLISDGPQPEVDDAATAWLAAHAGRSRRCGAVGTGTFLLAASRLLDGRRATTYWPTA